MSSNQIKIYNFAWTMKSGFNSLWFFITITCILLTSYQFSPQLSFLSCSLKGSVVGVLSSDILPSLYETVMVRLHAVRSLRYIFYFCCFLLQTDLYFYSISGMCDNCVSNTEIKELDVSGIIPSSGFLNQISYDFI